MDVKDVQEITADDYAGEEALRVTFSFSKVEAEALNQLRGESCSIEEYCRRQFIDLHDIADPEQAAKLLTHMEKEEDNA